MDTTNFLLTRNGLPYDYNKKSNTYTTFLVIHNDHIGYIFGANGKNIKSISSKTKTKISLENVNNFSNNNNWLKIDSINNLYNLISAYNRLTGLAINANLRTFKKYNYKEYLKKRSTSYTYSTYTYYTYTHSNYTHSTYTPTSDPSETYYTEIPYYYPPSPSPDYFPPVNNEDLEEV